MMNFSFLSRLSFIACVMVLLLQSSFVQEKKISEEELPTAVRATFEKSYPHAKIQGVSQEVEKGKKVYEIESMDGTVRRDLLFKADGSIVEIEEELAAGDLPAAVKATIQKKYPSEKVEKAEKITKGSIEEYELHLLAGKTRYEVVVAPDGVIRTREKENDEETETDDNGAEDD